MQLDPNPPYHPPQPGIPAAALQPHEFSRSLMRLRQSLPGIKEESARASLEGTSEAKPVMGSLDSLH